MSLIKTSRIVLLFLYIENSFTLSFLAGIVWVTPGAAQGLFLTLHQGITPASIKGCWG